MPATIVTCTHCGVRLKLKSLSQMGKKLTCPRCKRPFVIQPTRADEVGGGTSTLIPVTCQCGQFYEIRRELSHTSITCRVCGELLEPSRELDADGRDDAACATPGDFIRMIPAILGWAPDSSRAKKWRVRLVWAIPILLSLPMAARWVWEISRDPFGHIECLELVLVGFVFHLVGVLVFLVAPGGVDGDRLPHPVRVVLAYLASAWVLVSPNLVYWMSH